MPIRVNELKIRPCESADATALKAAQARLKARDADILSHRIVKKSVDARDKGDIRLIYSMDVTLAHDEAAWLAHLPRLCGKRRRLRFARWWRGWAPAGYLRRWPWPRRGFVPWFWNGGRR